MQYKIKKLNMVALASSIEFLPMIPFISRYKLNMHACISLLWVPPNKFYLINDIISRPSWKVSTLSSQYKIPQKDANTELSCTCSKSKHEMLKKIVSTSHQGFTERHVYSSAEYSRRICMHPMSIQIGRLWLLIFYLLWMCDRKKCLIGCTRDPKILKLSKLQEEKCVLLVIVILQWILNIAKSFEITSN